MTKRVGRTLEEIQRLNAEALTEVAMFKVKRQREERAKAMQCFGKIVAIVEKDPDPNTQQALQEEYNCKNCDSWQYCCQLAGTLS